MDKEFRDSEMNKLNIEALNTSALSSIKREYSLYEIAIMTRASPANILGLNDRGSLKPGKIADISIYDPKKPIDEMFSHAYLLFKEGIEIVKEGKITKVTSGNTLNVKLTYDKKIRNRIQKWFDDDKITKMKHVTGVGGGLVIDKKIVSGPNGVAGEWGHNQIPYFAAKKEKFDSSNAREAEIESFLSGLGLA